MEIEEYSKKIGIITGIFGTKYVGGAELQLYNLSREFSKMGYKIHVITSVESEIDPSSLQAEGISLHLLPCKALHTSSYKLDFYWNAWRKLVMVRPDICLVRTATLAPLAFLFKSMYGNRFIYSITSDKDCQKRKPKNVLTIPKATGRRTMQYIIKRADVVIAQTEYQKKELKKNFDINSLVIRNGHAVPKKPFKKSFPPIILWAANLRKEKRIDVFVNLARQFKDYNCRFEVAGNPMDAGCLGILEEGIRAVPNLYYHGPLSSEELLELMEKVSIFVNTSDSEGFPNTFIEAWMRKTPTVSLNVDPDDLIKKYRMGFHSLNFGDLVNHIRMLYEDGALLSEMGENAHRYAIKHHDITNISREYVKLF